MEWQYDFEQDLLEETSFQPGIENTDLTQTQPGYPYHVDTGYHAGPGNIVIFNSQNDPFNYINDQPVQSGQIAPYPIYQPPAQPEMDMAMFGYDPINQTQVIAHSLHLEGIDNSFAHMSIDSTGANLLPQTTASEAIQHPQPSNQEITDEEWEAKKEDIRRIYIRDNLTLKRTMELLKRSWRRPPTEAMYKSKLRQWGPEFSKNQTRRNAGSVPDQDERQPRRRQAQATTLQSAAVPTVPSSPSAQRETLESFVNNIRTFLGRVFDGSRATWRIDNFNFQSNSLARSSTQSWELLFHQSQEASILARGSRTRNLKFILEDMLLSIKSRFLNGGSAYELNDPYALVYFLRILMVFHAIRRRGFQRLEENRQALSATFLNKMEEFANLLPSEHPLAGFVASIKERLTLYQSLSQKFRAGLLSGVQNYPDEFIPFLSWAHAQILRCFVSHVGSDHPVILNMTEYHLSKWKRSYIDHSISIEAQYECLRRRLERVPPTSECGITLLLDYVMMASNRNKNQEVQLELAGLFQQLQGYSMDWIYRQEPLVFRPPTYAYIFSTEWLANKAYEYPKFFFSPATSYLEEGIEVLARGDQDCCIWASSFSKKLKLWYKGSNQNGRFSAELKREKQRLHDLTINLNLSVVLAEPLERDDEQSKREYDTKRRKKEEEEVYKLTGV